MGLGQGLEQVASYISFPLTSQWEAFWLLMWLSFSNNKSSPKLCLWSLLGWGTVCRRYSHSFLNLILQTFGEVIFALSFFLTLKVLKFSMQFSMYLYKYSYWKIFKPSVVVLLLAQILGHLLNLSCLHYIPYVFI